MSTNLVSVVMPTYNHAEFLSEAIESVLNQSYSQLELIVIDNFSEDDTKNIVKSFQDARIQYFKFANEGVIAASRNYGIKQAKGKYLAFIDSDDVWLKEKLSEQVDALEGDEEIGLGMFNFFFCGPPFY